MSERNVMTVRKAKLKHKNNFESILTNYVFFCLRLFLLALTAASYMRSKKKSM